MSEAAVAQASKSSGDCIAYTCVVNANEFLVAGAAASCLYCGAGVPAVRYNVRIRKFVRSLVQHALDEARMYPTQPE